MQLSDTQSVHDTSSTNTEDLAAWVALDDPAEWASFGEAQAEDNNIWESRLAIEGMHCAACAINVEKALKSVPGVLDAEVNATSGRARVTWQAKVAKPSIWMQAVSKAGYRAFPAADALLQDERRKNRRLMLWRLLVAGFCMMQVMMYAVPTYTSNPGDMTTDMRDLMRWASWILTLPVIFFSSVPFFSNALNDLRRRQISMDLPVALGILITFLVSTAATFEPSGWWGSEVYFDSLTMFVFFLLTGRWLELRMRDRTAGSLDALMRRLPSSIERMNPDGSYERVAVRRLVTGDKVRVLPGETFPGDGELINGETSVDEALLTGESKPVAKRMGDQVIAGSHNLASAVEVLLKQLGEATRYAQIVALMEQVSAEKPRLAQLADRIARPFLIGVLLAAAATAFYFWQTDHSKALMAAVSVLIVTCPCALSLATPAAMLTVSGALARKGVLVRRMQALEALVDIDTVVFDKTGTLTLPNLELVNISTSQEFNQNEALRLAAAMAQNSLHPVARALLAANETKLIRHTNIDIRHVQEISGAGLLAKSDKYGELKLGSSRFCGLGATKSDEYSQVHLMSEKGWLASFKLEETIKEHAAEAISALQKSSIHVEVLSGDQPTSVTRVTDKLGIKTYTAQCTPQEKLKRLQTLQHEGRRVLMVGDGLNDGPVLAAAHASIAMGQAAPLAQAKSDFVVLNGALSNISDLIYQARRTMRIVKQNLCWAAAYNAVCVPLAVAGMLPAWLAGLGMAASSLLVVLNAARLSYSGN